jgi:RNA polymerase sigma-70 factor, ECF subfamily
MAPARLPPIDELYARHRQRAVRIARRVLGDPHEAEDVVQEVFVRLWSRPDRFDGRSAWTTWLHRVTINGSISSLRARKQRGAPTPAPDAPPSPEELAVSRQMRELFARALEEVGGRHREVVWMREVRGLSYPEIAARLGIPVGTVKSTLHRGRSRAWAVMLRLQERTRAG